jgi:hypothetical protein
LDNAFLAPQWGAMLSRWSRRGSFRRLTSNGEMSDSGHSTFLASNDLWGLRGWHDRAFALIALIALQVAMALMSLRGAVKTEATR